PELVRDGECEAADVVAVLREPLVAFLERDEERVPRPGEPGRTRRLLLVHPPVGEAQRLGDVVRLRGEERDPVRRRDDEAAAALGQALARARDQGVRLLLVRRGRDEAELVAAEAVDVSVP